MKSLSKGRNSTPCDRDVVRRGMRRRHMTRDARRGGQNMGRTLQLGTGMGDRLFRMIPLVIEVSMGQSKALDSGESEPLLRKTFLSFGWWLASILVPDGARLLEGVTTSNYCSELGIHSHSIVAKTKNMNSTGGLTSYYIYFWVRETVPKPELSWNSALSSTLACDSENERGVARGKWPGLRKRGHVARGRSLF